MIIRSEHPKRIGIYFFYDRQGIADEYVFYFLERILPCLTELYIVCNGEVDQASQQRLERFAPVINRENIGMDVGAYRTVMEYLGYDRLGDYDELILTNSTIFGPLRPFSEMFQEMDRRNLDFWGITSHGAVAGNPFPQNGLKDLPEHIQSYFLAIRKPVLSSKEFEEYWEGMQQISSYEDSVSFHECIFTRHFSGLGFQWATYTGTEHMTEQSAQPIITMPTELVRNQRCPVVKRRSFFQDYEGLLQDTNGNPGRKLLDYLEHETDYPTEMIWENLIRTCYHSVLRDCLQLSFVLPEEGTAPAPAANTRVALWMHIYYTELAEECLSYARSMPEWADVILTTDSEEKKRYLEELFSSLPVRKLRVLQVENRGRDNSALLVGLAPLWREYDVICFAHDKKIRQLRYEVQGRTFSERCYHNTLCTAFFVKKVIALFADNPCLGVLCPPPPNTSVYYNTIGISDWGPNYENTKALYDRLGLTVPIRPDYDPTAPFGFVFWFRSSALRLLFEHGWQYEDFPEEPVDFDGTFLHAVERIIPFAAQQVGYYSGWLLSDRFAALELTNYHFMLRQLNQRLIPICGTEDFHGFCMSAERLASQPLRALYLAVKRLLRRRLSPEEFQKLRKLKMRITKRFQS